MCVAPQCSPPFSLPSKLREDLPRRIAARLGVLVPAVVLARRLLRRSFMTDRFYSARECYDA